MQKEYGHLKKKTFLGFRGRRLSIKLLENKRPVTAKLLTVRTRRYEPVIFSQVWTEIQP